MLLLLQVCIGGMFTASGKDLENIKDNKDYIHKFTEMDTFKRI